MGIRRRLSKCHSGLTPIFPDFGGREGLEVLEKALRDEVRHQAQSLE